MTLATRLLPALIVLHASIVVAEDDYVLIKDKVEHAFEHREEARGFGGTSEWKETIGKPGWELYDYSVHVKSIRGPGTSANYSVKNDKIIVDGQTGYESQFNAGGNYKAVVHALFIKVAPQASGINVDSLSGSLQLTGVHEGSAEVKSDLEGMAKALYENVPEEKIATATRVAFDVNGHEGRPYFHSSPNPNNNNHLWKLRSVGGNKKMIISKVREGALDSGGDGWYIHDDPNPNNPHHVWRFEKHGDAYMIISTQSGEALDANNAEKRPYLHDEPNPNNKNHLWRLVPVNGGWHMLVPVVERYE